MFNDVNKPPSNPTRTCLPILTTKFPIMKGVQVIQNQRINTQYICTFYTENLTSLRNFSFLVSINIKHAVVKSWITFERLYHTCEWYFICLSHINQQLTSIYSRPASRRSSFTFNSSQWQARIEYRSISLLERLFVFSSGINSTKWRFVNTSYRMEEGKTNIAMIH